MLNDWWSVGAPSGDVSKAGVLVHIFDNTENDMSAKQSIGLGAETAEAWLPCDARAWCGGFSGRFSASIINRHQNTIFHSQTTAGIVISPHTGIHCSYPFDGGTMQKLCPPDAPSGCFPGCATELGEANWCAHDDAWFFEASANIWNCAFRPADLEAMLRHHLLHRVGQYNEVVVDTTSYARNLPGSLLAVFFLSQSVGGSGESEWKARDVHRRFHDRFPDARVPLVRLDVTSEREAFVVV